MSMLDDVIEFMTKMEVGYTQDTITLYLELIDEEYEEWLEEFYGMDTNYSAERELKELCDILYVTLSYLAQITDGSNAKFDTFKGNETLTLALEDLLEAGYAAADNRVDKVLVTTVIAAIFKYARSRDWDIIEAFKRVHASNMSKLDDNGKPIRADSGKVVKGPNYKTPDLKDLV